MNSTCCLVAEAFAAGGSDDERAGSSRATIAGGRRSRTASWTSDPIPLVPSPDRSALAALAEPGTSSHPLARTREGIDETDAELLRLVVEGLSNEEIAERLGIAEVDVTRRLTTTYAKIGASSRADATAFAFQSGMV